MTTHTHRRPGVLCSVAGCQDLLSQCSPLEHAAVLSQRGMKPHFSFHGYRKSEDGRIHNTRDYICPIIKQDSISPYNYTGCSNRVREAGRGAEGASIHQDHSHGPLP